MSRLKIYLLIFLLVSLVTAGFALASLFVTSITVAINVLLVGVTVLTIGMNYIVKLNI